MPKYPGSGQAALINANSQIYLMKNESPGAGSPAYASIGVQLERQKAAFYPFGFAVEISFSGLPGTFEVDVQASETDQDGNYCLLGAAISAVNTSNVARFEGVNLWPRYVRVFVKTLGNPVTVTAVLTR